MILFIAAALFGALTIFFVIGLLTGQLDRTRRREMERVLRLERTRLQTEAVAEGNDVRAALLREDTVSDNEALSAFLRRFSWVKARAVTLEQGDVPLKVSEYALLLAMGYISLAVVATLITGFLPAGFLIGLGAIFIGEMFVTKRAKNRISQFNLQLPVALQMMATSLQSGFSTMEAIRTVAREMDAPLSQEFQRILEEARAGASFETSLERLAARIATPDMRIMTQALSVHREVGGNLGEILGQVAATMRERSELERHIKSLTSQERMSALLIAALPFLIIAMVGLSAPELISILWTTTIGYVLVGVALVLETIGFWLMRRVMTIEV